MTNTAKRIAHLIVLVGLLFKVPFTYAQNPGLDNLEDLLNSFESEEVGSHIISFTLPADAQQVNPTDYISFNFFNYTDIGEPDSISGTYTGTPAYQVVDRTLYVTGITIPPGASVTFNGINATNPIYMFNLYVIIKITEDFAGTIIKNSGTVVPINYDPLIYVSAQVGNPNANLQISGFAAPYTMVIFNQGYSVFGTANTGLNGIFSRLFTGIPAGTHTISFYGIDQANRATSTVAIVVDTPLFEVTKVLDQLLSPTIQVNDVSIDPGEPIYATGSAAPNATINVFTDSPLRSYTTTADANGNWTYTVTDTNTYSPGDYRIYTMAQTGTAIQSLFSPAIQFTITPSLGSGSAPACGDISDADLNCDNSVNLIDFSILMYYWGTTNPAADINLDGVVDIIDFSILMYYWG